MKTERRFALGLGSISAILAIGVGIVLFQNCGAPTVETMGSDSNGGFGGSPIYRLPPGGSDTPSQAPPSCSATATPFVSIGDSAIVTINSTQPLTGITLAVAYGNKNGQRDGSEVYPLSYPAVVQTDGTVRVLIPNPDGTTGGQYQRVFELRDAQGRALCQTGVVQFTMAGADCNLRSNQLSYASSDVVALFASYTQGSGIVPPDGSLRFEGFDLIGSNLIAVSPEVPPGHSAVPPMIPTGASLTDWFVPLNSNLANRDRIRQLVVRDSQLNVICRSNYIRYSVRN